MKKIGQATFLSRTALSLIVLSSVVTGLFVSASSTSAASSRTVAARQLTIPNPCPRFQPGSEITQPPDLFSKGGKLEVTLNYETVVNESDGFSPALQQFCFTTPDGKESPTLHVWPGDRLIIHLKNKIPKGTLTLNSDGTINGHQPPGTDNIHASGMMVDSPCLDSMMEADSTNIHFHGLDLPPLCGQDDVLHTLVNAGHEFTYDVRIAKDQPPGLYWYHAHIHGIDEGVVQGGASAAILVEGIQNIQRSVAGLPAQTFIIRDQPVPGFPTPVIGGEIPSWDLSVNYVTIRSCQSQQPCKPSQFVGDFTPAVLSIKPGEKQLWRVLNAASHTSLDLQLLYDGKPQPLTLVGLDGVPINSKNGTQIGSTLIQTDIPMAPAVRAEFIVTGPSVGVKSAVLKTQRVSTGPGGDNHPERPLITLRADPTASEPKLTIPPQQSAPDGKATDDLAALTPQEQRKLYFSEVLQDPNNPLSPTNFFITVDGATPTLFDPTNPPAIVTHEGAVEDWTIENRSQEDHDFHIHQIHFLLLERNGVPVPPEQKQFVDMVNIPFWSGQGPYPSVKVRMDFRNVPPGDLMYHCHFIFHADFGMMAVIRVLPKGR